MATPVLRARTALVLAQVALARASLLAPRAASMIKQAFDTTLAAHRPANAAAAELDVYKALDPANHVEAAADLEHALAAARAAYALALRDGTEALRQTSEVNLRHAQAILRMEQAVEAGVGVQDADLQEGVGVLSQGVDALGTALGLQSERLAMMQQGLNALATEVEEMPHTAEGVIFTP